MRSILHVGLIVNPVAGLGGSLALKGSDGTVVRALAADLAAEQLQRAQDRTVRALLTLKASKQRVRFSCWSGAMGEQALQMAGIDATVLGSPTAGLSTASDTRNASIRLLAAQVDLLLFAGGDGTARDIHDSVGLQCPVLGIPAGVKMHSGVFAVSPESAGELVARLAAGGLVNIKAQEVRDIDEVAFRADIVRSRFYGELMVPSAGRYLQHTKVSGQEDQRLVAADIALWQIENMEPDRMYLIGPGSTTAEIMAQLNLPNTLLGVDIICNRKLLHADVSADAILSSLPHVAGQVSIVVTAIGGQGYLFGRGNQQFSPAVIRRVGLTNIVVIAAKSKIAALNGRPLLVDTNDAALDREFSGLWTINTGYDDYLLYRLGESAAS